MDVSVANSLERALSACIVSFDYEKTKQVKQLLFSDIYSFIEYISKRNARDRFDYFCKVYLPDEKIEMPLLLNEEPVCQSIRYLHDEKKDSFLHEIVSFFEILGKFFVFDRFNRRDIDMDKYIEYLTAQEKYVKSVQPETVVGSNKGAKSNNTSQQTAEQEEQDSEAEAQSEEEPEESLVELLDKLDSMIGLEGVKKEVKEIIAIIKTQNRMKEFGEKCPPLSLHLVFNGNPGTGKTTVARLIAKIYKSLGVVSKGTFVEVDRGGLVASYVGQTAPKTQAVIDKAMGGILFIDEAYTLTHGKGENDFGQEAVDTILKAMEDHRDDFIVIAAGYPDLMEEFINSNPGLQSRFNTKIFFEDYTPDELNRIFSLYCKNSNLIISDDCQAFLTDYFQKLYDNRDANFANGRDVRNFFEKAYKMRALRLEPVIDTVSRDELMTLTLNDLKNAT